MEADAVNGADFLYVAVGTPPTESGDADLAAVWSVVDELPVDVPGRPIVVMKSTVPVGTGKHVRARLDPHVLDALLPWNWPTQHQQARAMLAGTGPGSAGYEFPSMYTLRSPSSEISQKAP